MRVERKMASFFNRIRHRTGIQYRRLSLLTTMMVIIGLVLQGCDVDIVLEDLDVEQRPTRTPSITPTTDPDEVSLARDIYSQPIWRCGTPTAVPTTCRNVTAAPTSDATKVCTTPEPTATTFQLITDFPLGKHIQVGGINGTGIGLWVWIDNVELTPKTVVSNGQSVEIYIAAWDMTVENASTETYYEYYPYTQSYVYESEMPDGTTLVQPLYPDYDAMIEIGQNVSDSELEQILLGVNAQYMEPGDTNTFRLATYVPGDVIRLAFTLAPGAEVDDYSGGEGLNDIVWYTGSNPDAEACTTEITPGADYLAPGAEIEVADIALQRWPVDGASESTIVRGFGCTDYFTGVLGSNCPDDSPWWHDGIDISVISDSNYYDVFPASGMVLHAGEDISGIDCTELSGSEAPHLGYGNYVQHTTYIGDKLVSVLGAHLSGIAPGISYQNATSIGEVLGYTGSTGCSTGPHLHFSLTVDGITYDPVFFLP